jgi:putative addiction module component (TIGR02574 family)
MVPSTQVVDIEALDVAQRLELLGRIWDSLIGHGQVPAPPAWHLEEVERRIARAKAEPGTAIPLEELRAELLGKRS